MLQNESMESDTSLMFLPGNHSLDTPLLVKNSASFRMCVTDSSDSTIIECEYLKGVNLHLDNVTDVHISGLQFIGCSSSFHLTRQAWIIDCMFSFSQKTALKFMDSTAYIAQSLFSHNEGGGYQLERNSLATAGGAIFANKSTIKIVNSFFQQNSAENGGAIYGHCNGNNILTLLNSTFTENAAKCKISRTGTTTYYGGVLYSKVCKIVINGSKFENNLAADIVETGTYVQNRDTHSHGGVLALFDSSAFIHHSAFTHNRASKSGGVIFAEVSKIVSTENGFYHNNAGTGGVICGERFKFSDKQSKFSKNEAHDAGVLCCFGIPWMCRAKFTSLISLNNATNGKLIEVMHGRISIVKSIVKNNFGGIVRGTNTQVEIISSEFANNIAGYDFSMIYLFLGTKVKIMESNFNNNSIHGGIGTVLRLESDHHAQPEVIINGSRFTNNSAVVWGRGGVISYRTFKSKIILVDCQFDSNLAESKGGVLYCDNERISLTSINVSNCTFHNNSAKDGGVVFANSGQISVLQSEFNANRALVGAVMFLSGNSLIKMKDVIIKKNAASTGTMYMMESRGIFSGNSSFSENLGSFLAYGSIINFMGYTTFNFSNSLLKPNALLHEGGAITAFQSEIIFNGKCILSNNTANYGGAVHATESKLYYYGDVKIQENQAAVSGGGIYLQQSEILSNNSNITLSKNTARNRGGGIHAIGSSIRLDFNSIVNVLNMYDVYYAGSQLALMMNKAKEGGGLYLESNAKLYILRKEMMVHERFLKIHKTHPLVNIAALTFTANYADYGGAIYVADNTNFATCSSVRNKLNSTTSISTSVECFFQVLLLNNYSSTEESVYLKSYLKFKKNNANKSGATLYGGLLDRCIVSPFTNTIFAESDANDTLSLFMENNNTEISSAPVRVCFCIMNEPDCSYQPPPVKIKKGQKFNVTVAAVDQVNQTVQNATIRSSLYSKYGGLGENQLSQITTGTCTDLHYEIFSPNTSEQLIMYAEGPCKDALPSQRRLEINFIPCSCLIGFQPSSNPTRCTCECDPDLILNGYITDCYPQTGGLVRKGNYWIAYLNSTSNSYLVYPNCPLDYCLPASSVVIFNLNTLDGAHAQCTNDHSGKLCGPCKPDLSLSLGSSRCIPCPKYWPALFVIILVAALLGGILLIAAILMFNLTVAVGTLNGIIFYANIVHANANVFLPFRGTNFITIFIAWLNLELGFDICFFEGMDAFWKTLLQLAFPMYLITLLIVIIVVSERYTWFARLFGKKNPVATLATLVLLSYVKLLHVIIASFSFIILKYPDGSKEIVWLPDATVGYFRGRHICLFFIALLVLLAGISYTVLLFFWQWLLQCKNKTVSKIVTYHRLYVFLEPYHAPYNYKHRYWTGLLLLVRATLYVIAAINVSNDPEVNLLAVAIAMTGILLLKGFANKSIYKRWPLDVLEVSCYANILCFCLATLYTLAGNIYRDGTVIAYISGSLIILKFIIVLSVELLSKPALRLWSKYKQRIHQMEELHEAELNQEGHQLEVTYSEVPAPAACEEVAQSCLSDNQNWCEYVKLETENETVPYHLMTK